MKNEEFEKLLDKRMAAIDAILSSKAKEYAFEGDRLWNFKVAAKVSSTTQQFALWGMAMKHLVSVMDLVNGFLANTEENVTEKIGDLINYLILLEAVLQEERK